jgi:hypothetical protein
MMVGCDEAQRTVGLCLRIVFCENYLDARQKNRQPRQLNNEELCNLYLSLILLGCGK